MSITKKQIAQWNETFKNSTKAEKRILIAEDVLLQLKKSKYEAYKGLYINLKNKYAFDTSIDVQSNFDKVDCRVCALGSCLISATKFKNTLKFDDLEISAAGKSWDLLKDIFTPQQLLLIEYAFEGNDWGDRVGKNRFKEKISKDNIKKCQKFFDSYLSSDGRLKAIMKNIIKNKGTFRI